MPNTPIHICHLSLLNPALHSRIYHKEARTQKAAGYEVTIIARDPATEPYKTKEGITIIPLETFPRISTQRLRARKIVYQHATAANADCYQIHTPELLQTGIQLKKDRPEIKLIYDVHEDYYQNIRYGGYYPKLLQKPLSKKTRTQEKKFAQQQADGIFYAETCYQNILEAPQEKTITILNKFQAPPQDRPGPVPRQELPRLLYTGTIAENWGVLRSLELWKDLCQIRPFRFIIAGHTEDTDLLREIRTYVTRNNLSGLFELLGGAEYLPFERILHEIRRAHCGMALYTLRQNIKDRIPTKFYEYMSQATPLLYTPNPTWDELNAQYDFGIPWPATKEAALQPRAQALSAPNTPQNHPGTLSELAPLLARPSGHRYRKPLPKTAWSWETEAEKMLKYLKTLYP